MLDRISDVVGKFAPKSSKGAGLSGGIGNGHGMVPFDDNVRSSFLDRSTATLYRRFIYVMRTGSLHTESREPCPPTPVRGLWSFSSFSPSLGCSGHGLCRVSFLVLPCDLWLACADSSLNLQMIVSKPAIVAHSGQIFFNFLSMACYASVAAFQAKHGVGPCALLSRNQLIPEESLKLTVWRGYDL